MPRRSNQFQKLITYLAAQLAPAGATVTESAELTERGTGLPREIDSLIEIKTGLTTIRIAVESQDRSRRRTVQWIDDLIGKYSDLPVDKVIAVASMGFSKGAQEKAKNHNIDLLSLREASDLDWPEQFRKLGIAITTFTFQCNGAGLDTNPPVPRPIPKGATVVENAPNSDGPQGVALTEFIALVAPDILAKAQEWFRANQLSVYKTLADLDHPALLEIPVPTSNLLWLEVDDFTYEIQRITFKVLIRPRKEIMGVRRHLLEDKASVTSAEVMTGDRAIKIAIAQIANSEGGIILVEQKKPKALT